MRASEVDAVATDGSTIAVQGQLSIAVATLAITAVDDGDCPDCGGGGGFANFDIDLPRMEVERLRDALTAWLDRGSM